MFKFFKKKKKKGCPACYDKSTIGFGIDHLEARFESTIIESEKIGNHQFFQCTNCQSMYYQERDLYEKLAEGQIEMLREFLIRDLALKDTQRDQLNEIGLTKDWNGNLLAPAKVKLKNGEIFDFATLRVSDQPPIGYAYYHYAKQFFLDEVATIEASEFAVASEIREKAKNAKEMRMGYYPTVTTTAQGEKVVLNGLALFFHNSGIKGADLTSDTQPWSHKEKYIFEGKIENQVLIIAKK